MILFIYLKEEVLAESVMMIPDSQRRLDEAIKKLSDLLVIIRFLFLYDILLG